MPLTNHQGIAGCLLMGLLKRSAKLSKRRRARKKCKQVLSAEVFETQSYCYTRTCSFQRSYYADPLALPSFAHQKPLNRRPLVLSPDMPLSRMKSQTISNRKNCERKQCCIHKINGSFQLLRAISTDDQTLGRENLTNTGSL